MKSAPSLNQAKGKIKFKVGASFFVLTFVMLVMRMSYAFASYIIALTLHEAAHAFAARIKEFKTNEIVLSAFGAVLYGEFDGITAKEEFFIVLAGPICNICLAVLIAGMWWFFPATYLFAEDFYYCNIAVCAVNLLPAYPLDGGRALLALLNKKFTPKRSERILQFTGITTSFCAFALFIYSCFTAVNLSFGLFSVFMFYNATTLIKKNAWNRTAATVDLKKLLRRGMEVKRFAVSHNLPLRSLAKLKSKKYLSEIAVLDDNYKTVGVISFVELDKMLIKEDLEKTLKEVFIK